MLGLVVALLAFLVAPPPPAETEVDVVFKRTVSRVEAGRILISLAPEANVVESTFEPVSVGAAFQHVPTQDQLDALFESGAISVETTRLDAQLASFGIEVPADEMRQRMRDAVREAQMEMPPYVVRIQYPGWWDSGRVQDTVEMITGKRPGMASKTANVLRVRVASGEVDALRQRLEAHPEVVAVTTAG